MFETHFFKKKFYSFTTYNEINKYIQWNLNIKSMGISLNKDQKKKKKSDL